MVVGRDVERDPGGVTQRFRDLDELAGLAPGVSLGSSGWVTVTQDRIDAFAAATGDHQWIHVDPERAGAGPFGATIAHGYLTLSLIPVLVRQIYDVERVRMRVNYGLDRVRFIAPVTSGSRVRATAELLRTERFPAGLRVYLAVTVETDRPERRPVCVAHTISQLYE